MFEPETYPVGTTISLGFPTPLITTPNVSPTKEDGGIPPGVPKEDGYVVNELPEYPTAETEGGNGPTCQRALDASNPPPDGENVDADTKPLKSKLPEPDQTTLGPT